MQLQKTDAIKGFTFDCTLLVDKSYPKTPLEFRSCCFQSYINCSIFHDFVEIFFAVINQQVLYKIDPDRLRLDLEAYNKFSFGLLLLSKLSTLENRSLLHQALNDNWDLTRSASWVKHYELEEFIKEIQCLALKLNNRMDAQTVKDYKAILDIVHKESPRLYEVWGLSHKYDSFVQESNEIRKQIENLKERVLASIKAKFKELPAEEVEADLPLLQNFFDMITVNARPIFAPAFLFASEINKLIFDSWATGEHVPHKAEVSKDVMESKITEAFDNCFPAINVLSLYEKPKPLPVPLSQPEAKPEPVITCVPTIELMRLPADGPAYKKASSSSTPLSKKFEPKPPVVKEPAEERVQRTIKLRKLLKQLYDEGFELVSQRGSHLKLARGSETVIVPNKEQQKPGTLHSILKKAGSLP